MQKVLKALRIIYSKFIPPPKLPEPVCERDAEKASEMIHHLLSSDAPCMIARFGNIELTTMVNYLGVHSEKRNIFKYIRSQQIDWWWNEKLLSSMQSNAGFFPSTVDKIERFCELMMDDIKQVDILGSWVPQEYCFREYLSKAQKVQLCLLEPFYSVNPWSRALKGKNVLVVHPFAKTIEAQYKRRQFLFSNEDILPEFNLYTIPAVQSLGGETHGFSDWFEALQWMKDEIDKINYDICLIGCGAYGFPLAAHVKRQGKKAVHLGGSLQLLFGIRGKRWENPNHGINDGVPPNFYVNLMNDYWVRPDDGLKPPSADKVEGGCYW